MAEVQRAVVPYDLDMEIASSQETWLPARRALAVLQKDGFLIGLVAALGGAVTSRLGVGISQDTWVSLVSGRSIARSGLPRLEVLTYWSKGRDWIDQQWLAHLATYGLFRAGGLVMLALASVAMVVLALAGAVVYCRRTGAGPRTAAWLVAGCAYAVLVGAGNVRTQVFALPLFVALLALLLADARAPSRRVFLVVPMLLLWGNLHGSVVVALTLVALRVLTGIRHRTERPRLLILGLSSCVAGMATPYGFAIIGYYRDTLLNAGFKSLVTEWRPLSLGVATAPIVALALGSLWLTARHTRRLGLFSILCQLCLVGLTFVAVRNAVWLGFGSLMLLGPALEAELTQTQRSNTRANLSLGLAGGAFLLIAVCSVLGRGAPALAKSFPAEAGNVVARYAAAVPGSRVYADERFADWVMFEHPALEGRLAYDARFEQLTTSQLRSTVEWKLQMTDHWRAAAREARVIAVALPRDERLDAALRTDNGLQRVFADREIAIFVRK
jgi:hypothetical protein